VMCSSREGRWASSAEKSWAVVNSELAKRQEVSEGRVHRLKYLAQASRARLIFLRDQDHQLQEQASAYEQHWMELSLQVMASKERAKLRSGITSPSKHGNSRQSGRCASAKPSCKSMQRGVWVS